MSSWQGVNKTNMEVFRIEPLTPEETEQLIFLTTNSFAISVVTMIIMMATSLYLVVKTKLKVRILLFVSLILLSSFLIFEQYMGGSLEMVLGPDGVLYSVLAHSASASLFCLGVIRLTLHSARLYKANAC